MRDFTPVNEASKIDTNEGVVLMDSDTGEACLLAHKFKWSVHSVLRSLKLNSTRLRMLGTNGKSEQGLPNPCPPSESSTN
jgi:hypothetical protein